MIPFKTIEEIINKHASLEKELASGQIEKKFFAEKSKEYADLNEIIQNARKYISYEKEKSEIKKILDDKKSDPELIKMAEIELKKRVPSKKVTSLMDYEECLKNVSTKKRMSPKVLFTTLRKRMRKEGKELKNDRQKGMARQGLEGNFEKYVNTQYA